MQLDKALLVRSPLAAYRTSHSRSLGTSPFPAPGTPPAPDLQKPRRSLKEHRRHSPHSSTGGARRRAARKVMQSKAGTRADDARRSVRAALSLGAKGREDAPSATTASTRTVVWARGRTAGFRVGGGWEEDALHGEERLHEDAVMPDCRRHGHGCDVCDCGCGRTSLGYG